MSFLFVNLFDTTGTLLGVATRAKLVNDDGNANASRPEPSTSYSKSPSVNASSPQSNPPTNPRSPQSWSPPIPVEAPPPLPKEPPPLLPIAKAVVEARPPAPPVPAKAKQPVQGTAKERSLSGSLTKRMRQKTKDAAIALAKKEDDEVKDTKVLGHKHMTKTQKKELKKEQKAKARARARASRETDDDDVSEEDKDNEEERRAWQDIE